MYVCVCVCVCVCVACREVNVNHRNETIVKSSGENDLMDRTRSLKIEKEGLVNSLG